MSSISKKASVKKPATKAAKSPATIAKKNTRTSRTSANGTSKRIVRRDVEADRFVETANEQMERVWGKIYARRDKSGKAA
jgi:hypothetical protein